jgi:hypothetical protein
MSQQKEKVAAEARLVEAFDRTSEAAGDYLAAETRQAKIVSGMALCRATNHVYSALKALGVNTKPPSKAKVAPAPEPAPVRVAALTATQAKARKVREAKPKA